jgi:sugar transferase (PEP-CTERM/EpsH1 system associated)
MHIVYTLRTGGMEMGVVKLVNGLDAARVRSSICSTTPAGAEIKALVQTSVPIFELSRRAGTDLRFVGDLYRLFKQERPDVVHTHAWGTLLEGLIAARAAGVPIVVHGEHGTLQLRGYQRRLQRVAWSAADRVLSVSSKLAERMSAATGFAAARITTIRNGVHVARFQPLDRREARRALGIPERLTVGTVGRLVAVKDQATLVDAVAELRRTGLAATLLIAGDGPERAALDARARAAGVDLRLLGYRADVEQVMGAMDVFVLSSVSEGLSNTILEAMATARPVVATRVGGAEEMIEDGVTGVLVPPSNAVAMAAALERVLGAADAGAAMGAAARRRVEAEFTLPGMMSRYEQLYAEVAAAKGLPTGSATATTLHGSGVA